MPVAFTGGGQEADRSGNIKCTGVKGGVGIVVFLEKKTDGPAACRYGNGIADRKLGVQLCAEMSDIGIGIGSRGVQAEASDKVDPLRLIGVEQIANAFPELASAGERIVEGIGIPARYMIQKMLNGVIDGTVRSRTSQIRGRASSGIGAHRNRPGRKHGAEHKNYDKADGLQALEQILHETFPLLYKKSILHYNIK